MKKLCDTMPLAGVIGVLGGLNSATVGKLSRYLRFHPTLSPFQVSCPRPAFAPLDPLLSNVDPESVVSQVVHDATPIWGYQVPADPTRIERVTCRVPQDEHNDYLVLESLEWGYAPEEDPSAFRAAVRVTLSTGASLDLPLVEAARVATFTTKDGVNPENGHPLWPLRAVHDPSIVHVFVYDITLGPGQAVALKDPDHPDAKKVRKLLDRLQEINEVDPEDDRTLDDFLFDDDLWEEDDSIRAPTGTVPEEVSLSFSPIRIVIAASLTVCRERDDFQPGRPMGVGRLYPHVMVLAGAKVARVDAGVRLTRPAKMTILDAESCSCGEMLSDIGAILVKDSNADAMVTPTMGGAPLPIWANLFNYYVPDPFRDPSLSHKLIPVVSATKTMPRDSHGLVDRDCSDVGVVPGILPTANQDRLTKAAREGQFDNIHVAPRMIVKDKIDLVEAAGMTVPFTSVADWKMDAVTMAPFCAHDCFHMHWRWTDNANTEKATFGWGPKSPYQVAGAPMVPQNQDVHLFLHSERAFSYLASARDIPHGVWQPFCHHGAGYALRVGSKVKAAKLLVPRSDGVKFSRVGPNGDLVPVIGDWALFYWRLRYAAKVVTKTAASGTEKTLGAVERFSFKDKASALEL